MKLLYAISILLFSPLLIAENFPGNIDPAAMEQMQKIEQEMMSCMQGVSEEDMQKISDITNKEIDNIHALCKAGSRDQAQSKAIALSEKLKGMPEMQTISKCYRKLESFGLQLPINEYNDLDKKLAKHHACDIR